MTDHDELLRSLIGETIVLDMAAEYVYIGELAGVDHRYLILEQADAHDLRDSSTTRELYVLDARRHGVGVNRSRVYVARSQIVSLSKLSDVQV
jgi:hypothetical protein